MAGAYLAARGINLSSEMAKVQFGADHRHSHSDDTSPSTQSRSISNKPPIQHILAARLPHKPVNTLWDLTLTTTGLISSITSHDPRTAASLSHSQSPLPGVLALSGRLLAPSLCHAHIHIDKCFLLQDPKYASLQIVEGSFDEAMRLTNEAKREFDVEDLMRRGRQLVRESLGYGVTCMRAFVEVDGGVGMKGLEAGVRLKREFEGRCEVLLCVFAQLALFSGGGEGEEVRRLMEQAAGMDEVDAVGSAPYVETDREKMERNVAWMVDLAMASGKPLDFHLDYYLEKDREPLVWHVLETLHAKDWMGNMESKARNVTLGHCTRLIHFSDNDWAALKKAFDKPKQGESHDEEKKQTMTLPISFVGLPTSDLFMMRSSSSSSSSPSLRGTLDIPHLIKTHGLDAAIAINNVGNAFTPQGTCDPLSIASLGVGLYHAGTNEDVELLYNCVSANAKHIIGATPTTLDLHVGEPADFVIFDHTRNAASASTSMSSSSLMDADADADASWRRRRSIAQVVYDAGVGRQTMRRGVLV